MNDKAEVIALIASLITDNTNGENTALRVREALGHIVTNTFNVVDDTRPTVLWMGKVSDTSTITTFFKQDAVTSVTYEFDNITDRGIIYINGVTLTSSNILVASDRHWSWNTSNNITTPATASFTSDVIVYYNGTL